MMPQRMLAQADPQPRTSVKKPLYTRLAQEWYLPPMKSTGVTLEYLRKVDANQVFRVGVVELNRFLAECRPSQLRRLPFVDKELAYAKVNRLLLEHGPVGLGFEQGSWPDGEWLYRVGRFVDPGNVCQLFEEAAGELPDTQADSVRLELGKRRVQEELEAELGLRARPEVQQAIAELRIDKQRTKSREIEINGLVLYGQKLERLLEEDRMKVDRSLDRLVQVALERVRTRTEPREREEYFNKLGQVREK